MNEIICPNCKKAFKVDEAGFADILKQVRDHEFEEELSNRLNLAEKEKENAVKLAEANLRNSLQESLSKKDSEISALKAKNEKELLEKLNAKDSELTEMRAKIENAELVKKLAISEVTNKYEKERDDLANVLKTVELEKQNLENSLIQKYSTELQNKDVIIQFKTDELERVKDMKLKLSTKMLGESLEQHCEIEFNKLRATAFG